MKPAELKQCRQCEKFFRPWSSTQTVCGRLCAGRYVKAAKKTEIATTKERREKLKTNGQRKAEAQRAINHWIVHVRDKDEPCISCGRFHQGAWHAGHFRSRGSAPHLALDPRNLAKQCAPCNLYLHGNLIEFRRALIEKHGVEFVEQLESDQTPRHYSGDDYEEIKRKYRELTREAKKETA